MPRYVALMNWTDQGVRSAKDTVTRRRQAEEGFAKAGIRLETVLWTQGRYDLIAISEAPDDATVAAAMLTLAGQGNLRTETMRAFDAAEMQGIVDRLG